MNSKKIALISLLMVVMVTTVASADVRMSDEVLTSAILVKPTRATKRAKAVAISDFRKEVAKRKRQLRAVGKTNSLETYRWNVIARELVIKSKLNPPRASRLYAYLSIAQSDSLVSISSKTSETAQVSTNRKILLGCAQAAIAASSIDILKYIFPSELGFITQEGVESDRRLSSLCLETEIILGKSIGKAVAVKVIDYANNDNSNDTTAYTVPLGGQYWKQTAAAPLLPNWGKVKTWVIDDIGAIRPLAPPAIGSEEFKAAVNEVKQISDTRSPEQLRIAQFWADGAGTSTPPGHWNEIAIEMLSAQKASESQAAKVLAVLNLAMMDAGICCWDAKYAYWLIRPSQFDPSITTPVGLPNFPSYTSGHSAFSGAAATILSSVIPKHKNSFSNMATQASLSRLYGGIHYRFDSEIGLNNGRVIGAKAIKKFLR